MPQFCRPCVSKVGPKAARRPLNEAIDYLRHAGTQHMLPLGLLARAHIRAAEGRLTGEGSAQEDLDEAWAIAEPGPMRLFMADIHLYRARLFFDAPTYPWDSVADDLKEARRLIETCGYGRRTEELEAAQAALLS